MYSPEAHDSGSEAEVYRDSGCWAGVDSQVLHCPAGVPSLDSWVVGREVVETLAGDQSLADSWVVCLELVLDSCVVGRELVETLDIWVVGW